jgi:glycosyltransferase involved in cell wall biosynthesis
MIHYGGWLRKLRATAFINTHIMHLPAQIHFLLPRPLYEVPQVRDPIRRLVRRIERSFAELYNQGDALVVQNQGLVDYWRERGVKVPIEVVGRPIDPKLFSRPVNDDPFPGGAKRGKRLLCVCRIDREKNLRTLVDVFEREIASADTEATLTLLGDGFERQNLIDVCRGSKYANRYFFPGEIKHSQLRDWYSHADVFVYTSLTETFGNVVNEALWNGLPVVALNDELGVAGQVEPSVNGFLVEPYRASTNRDFASAVHKLLRNPELRLKMASQAKAKAERTSHPDVVLRRYERLYEASIRRVRDEVKQPLAGSRGAFDQAAKSIALARHIGPWACWSSAIVALGRATVAFGISGTKTDDANSPRTSAPIHSTDLV